MCTPLKQKGESRTQPGSEWGAVTSHSPRSVNLPKLGFFYLAKSYEETSTFPPAGSKVMSAWLLEASRLGVGWVGGV